MRNNLFLGVAVAALVMPCAAMAQETTSSIRGTVTSGGAAVNGAAVTIVDTASGTTATATTDADGAFLVNGLRPGGPYTISVDAAGYQNQQVTDVNTIVAQTFDLPIELTAAGATGGEVVVTASRIPRARNVSQGPATVLTAAQVANVASVNRDIRDLERRDPFARLTDDGSAAGRSVSFAGQNARYNRFSVDGLAVTDNFGLNADGLPSRRSPIPLDAIGQFQAKVAPYDVREGNFQGGAINIVLKSGTNDFHGTGFYARSGDEFVGDKTKPGPGIPTGKAVIPNFRIDNYGAQLSGPLVKDRLFFMVAGERLRGGRPIPEGPVDNNAGTVVPNLTQAQIDAPLTALVPGVSTIAQSKYGYNTGGVLRDLGDKDDRAVAKLDANITDNQRLSLTYTYADDAFNSIQNTFTNISTGSPGLGLASNAYIQGNQLHTGVAQLNSRWSDTFSTEARGFYKHYRRIQDPVLGRGFAQFRVCTNPTSIGSLTGCEAGTLPAGVGTQAVVSFGPDASRQTNELVTETWGGLVQARLTMNNHDLRIFAEGSDVKIFNSFLQNSAGSYYFDSIADLQAGRAGSVTYANAIPSLVPEDAAANYHYQSYTFGIMDAWRITPTLNVTYGARYDLYGMHDNPAYSAAYQARYVGGATVMGQLDRVGPNTVNISGFNLFQPRAGFDWRPTSSLTIRGGGGIFGGGTPDVYVSNSFSNTGVLTNSVTIQRVATTGVGGNQSGFSGAGAPNITAANPTPATPAQVAAAQAVGNAALTNVNGTTISPILNTFLTNATVSTESNVNALDQDFKIPSQWRATLSADYNVNLGNFGNWTFGADALYSSVRNQVYFTDIRSVPVTVAANAFTPEGRQRYQNIIAVAASPTNSDILLTNTKKGRTYIGIARFDTTWDFGLSLNGSFTYQDVKDQAPATSSTAGSNYSNGAFADPNNVQYGISNDQVKYFFKYGATFDHAFFGEYKTTLALFGETRIGHPFSYTFQDFGTGRSAVFGVTGRSSATSTAGQRYLLYVPTVNDARVSYSDAAYQTAFNAFIDSSKLAKYRGSVAPRNAFHSKWFTRLDLHAAQELPTGLNGSKLQVFADIENFTNFINKKWGQIREYAFPYNVALTQVQCLTTAGNANGAGTVAASTAQPCAQYRYSPLGGTTSFSAPVDQVYVNPSLYSIRVGARFTF